MYAKEKLVGWGKRLVNSGSPRLSSLQLERLSAAHREALGHATSSLCIYARGKRRLMERGFMWGKGECSSVQEREAGRMQSNRFLYLAGIKGVCVCVGVWEAGTTYTME